MNPFSCHDIWKPLLPFFSLQDLNSFSLICKDTAVLTRRNRLLRQIRLRKRTHIKHTFGVVEGYVLGRKYVYPIIRIYNFSYTTRHHFPAAIGSNIVRHTLSYGNGFVYFADKEMPLKVSKRPKQKKIFIPDGEFAAITHSPCIIKDHTAVREWTYSKGWKFTRDWKKDWHSRLYSHYLCFVRALKSVYWPREFTAG